MRFTIQTALSPSLSDSSIISGNNTSKINVDSSNQSTVNPGEYLETDYMSSYEILYFTIDSIVLLQNSNYPAIKFITGMNIILERENLKASFTLDSFTFFGAGNSLTRLKISNYDKSPLSPNWYDKFASETSSGEIIYAHEDSRITIDSVFEKSNVYRQLISSIDISKTASNTRAYKATVMNSADPNKVSKIITRYRIVPDLKNNYGVLDATLQVPAYVKIVNGKVIMPLLKWDLKSDEFLEYEFSGVPIYSGQEILTKGRGYNDLPKVGVAEGGNGNRITVTGYFTQGALSSFIITDSGNDTFNYTIPPVIKFYENGIYKGASITFSDFKLDKFNIKNQSKNFETVPTFTSTIPISLNLTIELTKGSSIKNIEVVNGGSNFLKNDTFVVDAISYESPCTGTVTIDSNEKLLECKINDAGNGYKSPSSISFSSSNTSASFFIETDTNTVWRYVENTPNTPFSLNLKKDFIYELQSVSISKNPELDKYTESIVFQYENI